jgi:hypothetical protein
MMVDEGLTAEQRETIVLTAIEYATTRGWAVFPWNVTARCSYKTATGSNGKAWGATMVEAEIWADFEAYPDAGIGVATGEQSGFFVIDADVPDGHAANGVATLAELEERHGALPETLRAQSPSGGDHYYFKWPQGIELRNSASLIGPGVDCRASGGMIVAPPTVRPGKGIYEWVSTAPIADCPQWLLDRCRRVAEDEPQERGIAYYGCHNMPLFSCEADFRSWCQEEKQSHIEPLAQAHPPGRNHLLFKTAANLGELVELRGLLHSDASESLYQACVVNGLTRDTGGPRGVRSTISSGFKKGAANQAGETVEFTRSAQSPPRGGQVEPWPFVAARDFRTDFNRNWIMKGVLAPGEVSNWIGPPGTGKSTLVGDLLLHVVAGRDWRGHLSKKSGAVIYFALERSDLIKRRFNAQAALYGLDAKEMPFFVVDAVVDMMSDLSTKRFISTIRAVEQQCGVGVITICIDTSAKAIAAGGADENEAKSKNLMRANGRRIISEINNLHLCMIGHTGKNVDLGERGSNASAGDDDVLVLLNKTTATVLKRNDGPEGPLTKYRLVSTDVGTDEDGEVISISVIADDDGEAAPDPAEQIKGQPGLALRFLVEAIVEHGRPPPPHLGLPSSVPLVVEFDRWEAHCKKRGLAKGDKRTTHQTAFSRASDKLLSMNAIAISEDWAWPIYKEPPPWTEDAT